jgi:hypothetical protein
VLLILSQNVCVLGPDPDELIVCKDDKLGTRILLVQVDLIDPLDGALNFDQNGETANFLQLSLVFKVDPVTIFSARWLSGTLNLENIVTDADSGVLDETTETNNLGSNVNIQSKSIREFGVFGNDGIRNALASR